MRENRKILNPCAVAPTVAYMYLLQKPSSKMGTPIAVENTSLLARINRGRVMVSSEKSHDIRNLLRFYLGYRILLALTLGALLLAGLTQNFLGTLSPSVYNVTVIVYLVLTIASISFCQCDIATAEVEYLFAILVDCLAIAMFMYTSGGVQSGLGILLAVSIAFGGLGLSGRGALVAAAMAALAILGITLYSSLAHSVGMADYTQVGLLGFFYFALAVLAQQLSTRAAASEKLAQQRGRDLASLTKLNEYVIQGIQAGVVVVDHNHQLRLVNESAWSLLGMPNSRIGEPLSHASTALDSQLSDWLIQPFTHKVIFRTNRDSRDLQASFRPLGDNDNPGTLIFLEDTGWLLEQAQQLKLASLGRLTASIAHEIRNPLGAISHAAQLLEESEGLDKTDHRMTEIIGNNSKRINNVIENILAMSKRAPAVPEELPLHAWLHKLCTELTANHAMLPDQVKLHVQPDDTALFADKQQLTQVISSLFDNAVTHFPGDIDQLGIHITAGTTNESSGPYIQITDNGSGIPADIASKIFDPFFTTRHDGTGLGLYITRELCEANNIRLEYIPISIGGSCFRLSLTGRKPSKI